MRNPGTATWSVSWFWKLPMAIFDIESCHKQNQIRNVVFVVAENYFWLDFAQKVIFGFAKTGIAKSKITFHPCLSPCHKDHLVLFHPKSLEKNFSKYVFWLSQIPWCKLWKIQFCFRMTHSKTKSIFEVPRNLQKMIQLLVQLRGVIPQPQHEGRSLTGLCRWSSGRI